jgi:hypothetical protein
MPAFYTPGDLTVTTKHFQAVPYPAFLKNPVSKFLKTAYFKQQSETRNLKCSLCSWQGEHFIALSIAQ